MVVIVAATGGPAGVARAGRAACAGACAAQIDRADLNVAAGERGIDRTAGPAAAAARIRGDVGAVGDRAAVLRRATDAARAAAHCHRAQRERAGRID